MTNGRHKPEWWREKMRCEPCDAEFTRHHRKRHEATPGHQKALARYWAPMPSDEEFARFLYSIKPSQLRGYERRLFKYYQGERISA